MSQTQDIDLLREFAVHRRESAFAELTRRYIDLVYSVAFRVAVDPHLAQDITQSVFVALAQQSASVARKLERGTPLSGWLHVTARNLAANTVRCEVRRRAREQTIATTMNDDSESQEQWDQLSPHLDHALAELEETDRHAILLRFFERKSILQVGSQLGLSEAAAQKRVSRAVERLRERLNRRGVRTLSGAFSALLLAHSIQAAPIALSASIVPVALVAASTAPSGLLAITAKISSSLAMTKAQLATSVAIAAAITIPIALQQRSIANLRQEVKTMAERPESERPQNSLNTPPIETSFPSAEALDETAEIARLRSEAEQLRARINAAKEPAAETPQPLLPGRVIGPTLLALGRSVSSQDLVYAGNETPEASLQSLMVSRLKGDLDAVEALIAFSPKLAAKWQQRLATEEQRAEAREEMMAEAHGAVVQSSVKQNADGSQSEPQTKVKWPETTEATFTVAGKDPIDDQRVQLVLKTLRGADEKTETLTFGRTKNGWKFVP